MQPQPSASSYTQQDPEERRRWLVVEREAREGLLGEFRRDLLLEREQREGQLQALRQQLDEGSARLEAFAEKVLANDLCGNKIPENGAGDAVSFMEMVRDSIRQLAEDVAMEKANRSEALACVERRLDAMSATLYAQVAELRVCGDEASGTAHVAELRVAELETQLAGLAEIPARCCAEGGTSGLPNGAIGVGTVLKEAGGGSIMAPGLEKTLEELSERAEEEKEKIRAYAEQVSEKLVALRAAELHIRGKQQVADAPDEAITTLERKLDEVSCALNAQVAAIRASTDAVTERFNAQMLELRERADDDAVSIMEAVRADVYRLAEDLNKERAGRCDQLGRIEKRLNLLDGAPPMRFETVGQGDAGCIEQRPDHLGVAPPVRLKEAAGQCDETGLGPRLAA